jgi:hypothetical protein
MLARVDQATGLLTAFVALPTLYFAYLTYRDRLPRKRLQFVVTTNSVVLPAALAESLHLLHNQEEVPDPALIIIRLVCTGDKAITTDDYESDIKITLSGSKGIANATCTGRRPAGLEPGIDVDGTVARIKPLLLNPEDMLQLHLLAAGKPDSVSIEGRVADLAIEQLQELPYPPGGGPEGELNAVDFFIWWIVSPALILFLGGVLAFDSNASTAIRIIAPIAAALFGLILYPRRVKFLINRRAMWRPE